MSIAKDFPATPVPFDVLTLHAERLIREFMESASKLDAQGDTYGACSRRDWAFGVYMQWQASAPQGMMIPPNDRLWLLVMPEDAEAPV